MRQFSQRDLAAVSRRAKDSDRAAKRGGRRTTMADNPPPRNGKRGQKNGQRNWLKVS
jgi:hypothetical protein